MLSDRGRIGFVPSAIPWLTHPNAYCQSPVCNPSRASLMTSLYPETSGIDFLNPDIAASPVAKQSITMPKRFESEGYHGTAGGKPFAAAEKSGGDPRSGVDRPSILRGLAAFPMRQFFFRRRVLYGAIVMRYMRRPSGAAVSV